MGPVKFAQICEATFLSGLSIGNINDHSQPTFAQLFIPFFRNISSEKPFNTIPAEDRPFEK